MERERVASSRGFKAMAKVPVVNCSVPESTEAKGSGENRPELGF